MDHNPGGDDDRDRRSTHDRHSRTPARTGDELPAGQANSGDDTSPPTRPRISLPSFSEFIRSLALHPAPASPISNPQSSPPNQRLDPPRLTPLFSDLPAPHSPTRVRFPSTTTSPTRAGPSRESTAILPPRQQGNNALPPAPTTALPSLETRAESRYPTSSLATRGGAQYRIPGFHQQPTATASERIAGSQSKNFQFYLVDRAAPRTYRACTHCRARKVKCETDPSRDRCRRCIERGLRCMEAIPISPLVGSVLSSDRDAIPSSRKHRSESDPTNPRDRPPRPTIPNTVDLDPQSSISSTTPTQSQHHISTILPPPNTPITADSPSTSTQSKPPDRAIDITQSPKRRGHRHTLSAEYRSSHRHDPVGSTERRPRTSLRGQEATGPMEATASGFREKNVQKAQMDTENDSISRPRAFSNPVLRTSSHFQARRLPPPPSFAGPSTGPGTQSVTSPPAQSPPISPESPISSSRRVASSSPPHPESPNPSVSMAQSQLRSHRR